MTEVELHERIKTICAQRTPELIATLRPFLEKPGAQTCYDSEKRLHELLRVFGDDVFGEVLKNTMDDETVKAPVLAAAAKKNSPSTVNGELPKSSSAEGPVNRRPKLTPYRRRKMTPPRRA